MNDYQLAILYMFLAYFCCLKARERKKQERDDTIWVVCIYMFLLVIDVIRVYSQ